MMYISHLHESVKYECLHQYLCSATSITLTFWLRQGCAAEHSARECDVMVMRLHTRTLVLAWIDSTW